ncbi:MAG: lipoyl synthase [Vicinamibacteria bacterium]
MSVLVPLTLRRPDWIKARAPVGERYESLRSLMRDLDLHTVCEEARCPNVGDCWNRGTATFMILGDVCTRACGFCAVKTGLPGAPPDQGEPRRVADAVARLGLRHAVVTSVNRDDQKDGGASIFAACIREIRERIPTCAVEVLVPDFKGNWDALAAVLEARPDILNHNTETVPRLYRHVRPGARFERSLELLRRSKESGLLTKSGIMVGLGEEWEEVLDCIRSIRGAGTDILTVGQYLRPSLQHLPLVRYYTPEEFGRLREFALGLGYGHVESGPLVRSSYHADEHVPASERGGAAPHPLEPPLAPRE